MPLSSVNLGGGADFFFTECICEVYFGNEREHIDGNIIDEQTPDNVTTLMLVFKYL